MFDGLPFTDEGGFAPASGGVVDGFGDAVPECVTGLGGFVGGADPGVVAEVVVDDLSDLGGGLVGLGVEERIEKFRHSVNASGSHELQLLAVIFDKCFGRIESVFGGILGIAIECGVVPLVEEAFVVVVGDIELVGTDGSDGSQEDVEGLAGLVAGTSE